MPHLPGVALAMTIPLLRKDGSGFIHALEEGLHPYVKFLILPLFAFANAGIPLAGLSMEALTSSLPLGIAIGPRCLENPWAFRSPFLPVYHLGLRNCRSGQIGST